MISLNFAFWMFIVFFGVVGAMRGWAAELLVSFSAVLAIFIIIILERFVPFVNELGQQDVVGVPADFWIRTTTIALFAFFGYQTPRFPAIARAKVARERVQDTILGILVGGVNGYLIIGSLWHYLHLLNYSLTTENGYIIPPNATTQLGAKTIELIAILPPAWLTPPWIYFAVAIAFAFVVIVFV